jgi:hypothetical protein
MHLLLKGLTENEPMLVEHGGLHKFIHQKCKIHETKGIANLINLDELNNLRAEYLTDMLTPGNPRCCESFMTKFMNKMKSDENVQDVLLKMVGKDNAEKILALDPSKTNRNKLMSITSAGESGLLHTIITSILFVLKIQLSGMKMRPSCTSMC